MKMQQSEYDLFWSILRWPHWVCAVLQLFFLMSLSLNESFLCRRMGDPERPHMSKDGDILLGGIFYFHNNWKNRENSYTQKPLPLECNR